MDVVAPSLGVSGEIFLDLNRFDRLNPYPDAGDVISLGPSGVEVRLFVVSHVELVFGVWSFGLHGMAGGSAPG